MDYTYRLDAKRVFVAGHRGAAIGEENCEVPADFLLDNLLIEANVIRRRRGHNPASGNDDLPAPEAPRTTSARSAPASRISRSRSRARRT
ncbi:MAG: hypothetical protein E5X67_05980 [Mesorhizobium sp.]|nr:MAG: hypothetical protein E5X67_05980 [Mesorhizobium sp.]